MIDEVLREFKSSLTESDKAFLFNSIVDHVFKGKEPFKKLEAFLDLKFPSSKRTLLNWIREILNGDVDSVKAWIEEYLGETYSKRFERRSKVNGVCGEIKVDDFEEYVTGLKGFSGLVKGVGEDRVAEVYLKEGEIVGAVVKTDNDVYEGLSALYYLDFPAKVYMREGNFVPRKEISLSKSKEQILKKYKIRPPNEKEVEDLIAENIYNMTGNSKRDQV